VELGIEPGNPAESHATIIVARVRAVVGQGAARDGGVGTEVTIEPLGAPGTVAAAGWPFHGDLRVPLDELFCKASSSSRAGLWRHVSAASAMAEEARNRPFRLHRGCKDKYFRNGMRCDAAVPNIPMQDRAVSLPDGQGVRAGGGKVRARATAVVVEEGVPRRWR
jgi:hypothetical protein